MKQKIFKILFILVVILAFSFSVMKVYAQTTGVDLLQLAKGKVVNIIYANTSNVSNDLQNSRIQVENDTLNYIDQYIDGIDSEINSYVQSQKENSYKKLYKYNSDIKDELSLIRQGIINDAKAQIDEIIEQKYQEQQQILNDELKEKIEQKFK